MTTRDLLVLKPAAGNGKLIMFQLIADNGDVVCVRQITWSKLSDVMDDVAKHVSVELYKTIVDEIKKEQGASWFYDIMCVYMLPKDLLKIQQENFFD